MKCPIRFRREINTDLVQGLGPGQSEVDAVESQSQSGCELRAYLWASGPRVALVLMV